MTQPVPDRIAAATFRGSPAFELVVLDRLKQEQRAALGDAQHDPDLYGVLLPREPGRPAKAVDRDTALLYLTLQQPGPLPTYVPASLGARFEATMTRLVLDGVLEIAHAGGFVSGPDALGVLGGGSPPEEHDRGGRIARLSLDALRYAAGLEIADLPTLAGRIYAYNRLPLSPGWARRLPSRTAVAEYLDVSEGGRTAALIGRRWTQSAGAEDGDVWRAWSRAAGHGSNGGTTHKLYVSPHAAELPEALRVTVEVLGETAASGFKVGADLPGVLRPDKLVAYFPGFDSLADAAERLRARLQGFAPHGVPFTAEITRDGLLSWGVDPPRGEQTLGVSGGESWRVWLAHRLAGALLAARVAGRDAPEPWRYALERIRLEGVDPRTWAPGQAMWRAEAAGR
jgi:hypothetical protein